MSESKKWVMEIQTAEDGDLIRILQVGGGLAELKYVAMSEEDATALISAFEWMECFRNGVVKAIPTVKKPKPKTAGRPRTQKMLFELEVPMEPPPKRPKP